ncbi:MAG: LytTR family transcriptional regulator [bacterium]|nr:LytTR family transcriptional regulator [bacterium]
MLHISDGQRRVVDPEDVYYLESVDDETHVRLRGARPVVDLRNLGEVLPEFEPYGFLRIHRSPTAATGRSRSSRPSTGDERIRQRNRTVMRADMRVSIFISIIRRICVRLCGRAYSPA